MAFDRRWLYRIAKCTAVALLLHAGTPAALAAASADRPNVIFIMTDDAGYGDTGAYGVRDIRTPNIDRLAREGMRFTDFYSNGATCSPTRAGLLTGRYQQRVAIDMPLGSSGPGIATAGLPADGRTLPQLLRNHGYHTALIGKWHLGSTPDRSPNAHGFDEFFGFKSGYIDHYQHMDGSGQPDLYENDTPVKADGYMTDLITARAVQFISRQPSKPFFLSLQYNAPHWPYQPPDKPSVAVRNSAHLLAYDESSGTRADYAAMVERVDRGIGEVLRALDAAGMRKNTLVIFTNDNGGEWLSRNEPFFNRKFTVWEGGIRVPALFRWPGRIPAGRTTAQVGITMDVTTTVLAAAGAAVSADLRLEGRNLLPVLEGRSKPFERTLFWRAGVPGTARAVRSGDWKLQVDGQRIHLFDLRRDPGERTDLAWQQQALTRKLWLQLNEWEKDVDAEAVARGFRRTARPDR
jgi:arylsulfatase A-like enzyme